MDFAPELYHVPTVAIPSHRAVQRFIALALFSSGPGADHLLFVQERKEDGGRIAQGTICEHACSEENKKRPPFGGLLYGFSSG